jgi:hypothetical protein
MSIHQLALIEGSRELIYSEALKASLERKNGCRRRRDRRNGSCGLDDSDPFQWR